MSKRNMLAVLRPDGGTRDVERYADREVSALLYGDRSLDGPMLQATITRMATDGSTYVHLVTCDARGQRKGLMRAVPMSELAAAEIVVPLSMQDVTDIMGAVSLAFYSQPEKRDALLAKLEGRR